MKRFHITAAQLLLLLEGNVEQLSQELEFTGKRKDD